MPESDIDRLERVVVTTATTVAALTKDVVALTANVSTLTKDLTALTKDVQLNREDIGKLNSALQLLNGDIEKHGLVLRRLEIEEARESGRKEAMGDLQTKLLSHDDAARKVAHLENVTLDQKLLLDKLKTAHDQQRGVMLAMSIVAPVVVTLVTAFLAKLFGVA